MNQNKNKFSTLPTADWKSSLMIYILTKVTLKSYLLRVINARSCSPSQSSSRRDVCERRTAMARNEYILSLAATNAHMTRYFCKELEDIMSVSYAVKTTTHLNTLLDILSSQILNKLKNVPSKYVFFLNLFYFSP